MPARSSQEDAIFVDPKALRDACLSRDTRNKYTGSINGIKTWLREERSALDPNIARYFTADGDLNLSEFTPAVFEDFLAYKRTRVKAVTLGGFRSAIKDLYRTRELSFPVEYGEGMKRIFSGIKRY
ncbi:hypothetical protein F442_22022 [Phytophthora nicotianae P10297]|uniref:Core-binding (CB) domain-containing protein n=1 Tax=Phytophthora nicotianae P10297 TaxID=1317064 RepID=W2Y1X4_PHYNI|nr:hypothetical protein F442_22022 [Phytophthora nicotianae P10297]